MSNDGLILVTGGAGFIGSNLVAALNREGYKNIIIADRILGDAWKNLEGLSFTDYCDKDDLLQAIREGRVAPKTVFHLGACADTTQSDANFLLANNTLYSKALFDYCIRNGARFFYASSGATYGRGEQGFNDREWNLHPINAYGYSKHLFDEWVRDADHYPPQWAGFKFFNVYGPNEYHKGFMASVVLHSYEQMRDTGTIKLFKSYKKGIADGEQKRDFIYVKDAVSVMLFFLKHPDISGIFNVGTGKAETYLALAKAVFAAVGKEPKIEFVDMPQGLPAIYQYVTEADISALRSAGYKEPFAPLEEGVKDYVQNYLAKR